MKLIIKIIIFCAFTLAIWGVFTLVAGGSAKTDFSGLYRSNVDEINNTITADWANAAGWDPEIYHNQMVMIAQSHNAEIISDDARTSLRDRVNREAYSKIIAAMKEQFANPDCEKTILDANYEGLQTVIANQPGVEKIPEVAEVERVYNLYNRIYNFIRRPIGLTPRFNPDEVTWLPAFAPYSASLLRTKAELLGNPLYAQYLSNITDLKSIHQTEQKINDASSRYYDSLYNQISGHFTLRASNATESDDIRAVKQSLNAVRSAVFNEIGNSSNITSRLRSLYDSLF